MSSHQPVQNTPIKNPAKRPAQPKAFFLVFEGLDGSGKTTLIQHVSNSLMLRGRKPILTREPGGTPLAEELRGVLLRTDDETPTAATELLLYAASRAQHVARVIRPALESGTWVLCDRFRASSVAFQSFARGVPRVDVDWLNDFACQGLKPHLTILLDISIDETRRRRSDRESQSTVGADRMESESAQFHAAVRKGYLEQAREDQANWLVLDATHTPDRLNAQVLKELEERGWLES